MRTFLCSVLIFLFTASALCAQQQPNLSLHDLSGAEHSLAEYQDKIVVLNFWATWCIPCKYEMPLLVQLHQRYRDQVTIIAASLDDKDTQKRIPKYIERHHIEFAVWVGANNAMLQDFGLEGIVPSTLFLDRDGKIIGRVIGELKKKDLYSRIDWMLSDRTGPAPKPLVKNVD